MKQVNGFDHERYAVAQGVVEIYKEAFGGDHFFVPLLSHEDWPALKNDDPAFAAKAWFALTIGRGALSHCGILDESGLAEALGATAEEGNLIAPGYYVMGPDGVCAAAYICDEMDKNDDPSTGENWSTFESKTRAFLSRKSAWDSESFSTRVAIAPDRLIQKDNLLGDALESGFEAGSLKKYGIYCENKKEGEEGFIAGFPSAWVMKGAEPYADVQAGSTFSIEAPFSEFKGAPFVNHNGKSFAKNIRPFAHVNNTDESVGANQIEAREKIVASMIDAWINATRSEMGLADDENGIDAKNLTKGEAKAQRAVAARAYASKIGNDKKLAYHPMKSAVRSSPVEDRVIYKKVKKVRDGLIISRDMAIVDGQHSARNYALLAMALSNPAPVKWDGVTVKNCSQLFFKKKLLEALGLADASTDGEKGSKARAKTSKKNEDGLLIDPKIKEFVKLLKKEGNTDKEIFESFQEFGSQLRAGVQALPVLSPAHARSISVIANDSAAVSIASKAEHAEIELFRDFAAKFNKVAVKEEDPARLVTTKSSLSDPTWATNASDIWPLQSIFGSLMASATRFNNAGDKVGGNELAKGEEAVRAIFYKGVPGRLSDFAKSMAQKMGLMLTVFGKIKSRDFELGPSSLEAFKGKMTTLVAARGEEIERALSEGGPLTKSKDGKAIDLPVFAAKTLKEAARIYFQVDPVSLSQEQRVYAMGKAAMAFQAKLDQAWEKMTVGKATGDDEAPLPKLFRTKATFVNWMILGTLQSQGEIASEQSLGNIDIALSNMMDLLNSGSLGKGASHNASRQALTNAINVEKSSPTGINPLMAIESNHLKLLLDAFPHPAPGTVDLEQASKGDVKIIAKLKSALSFK